MIFFVGILDPDQAKQNVRPALDPKCLTLLVFLKECFHTKKIFKKKSAEDKKVWNLPIMQ